MSRDWEATFTSWAQPPGKTEADRIENAIRAIRAALEDDERLAPVTKVFPQGSYRNRVNVRQDSDIDVGILYEGNVFFPKYPDRMTDADFGNGPAAYTYGQFKDEVGRALIRRFGAGGVRRGDKTFDIHENTYRLDADVTPFFEHRRYSPDGSYICGVELHPDGGGHIINWPERLYDDARWPLQHYENGLAKNNATARAYRGVARILKTLRSEMEDAGIAAAKAIAGFLVECLTWNAPDWCFTASTWDARVQLVLGQVWSNTSTWEACADWREVSRLKYLFRGCPPSKRVESCEFVDAAWNYIGVRAQ